MGAEATHTVEELTLARRPSGADVTVTVHRYAGGPGPLVYVQAAQHGIELNGPAALRRLHERLVGADLAGTVVAVPVVNSLAFDHRSYLTPAELDGQHPNLNRVWPGEASGSLQERMAARLWKLVTDADAAVDLHTGTADMLEHVRFRRGATRSRTLAEAFGTPYLLADEPDTDPEADDFGGKFRTAAARAGIPAITAELANSRQIARPAVEAGVAGVANVLRTLDVLPGGASEADRRSTDDTDPTLLGDDESARAGTAGLFELRSGLGVGDRVGAGDELGRLYCPSSFECLETVTAPTGGVVYSVAREAVVVAGERVAAIAPRL